uniref:Uncharacterized protein n=1 Tax=Romanomermis culicivorax TaxID=13658 RepID=A0A915IAX7_ROMCU
MSSTIFLFDNAIIRQPFIFICKQLFLKAVKPGRIFLFASKRAVHFCLFDDSSDRRTHRNRIIVSPAPPFHYSCSRRNAIATFSSGDVLLDVSVPPNGCPTVATVPDDKAFDVLVLSLAKPAFLAVLRHAAFAIPLKKKWNK